MRRKIRSNHKAKPFALIAGCAILSCGIGGQAQAVPPEQPTAEAEAKVKVKTVKAKTAESEILRRLKELETQVTHYREETVRLQAELGQKQAKPVAKTTSAGGEWDEPEVDKKPEGRDEEARRRLLVLETQARKVAAKEAKQEEERADKFKFEVSGKYKGRFNSNNNFNLNNPRQEWAYDNANFYDQRYSLQVDATYEALLARLVLDKGNFNNSWKEGSEGTYERWGSFQTLNSQLVRELFVQYTGPFMLRAGRQNWDVGQRLVLEGPMDGLRIRYPLGQLPWGQTAMSVGYMAVAGGWGGYDKFNATGGRLSGSREEMFGASNRMDGWYADLDIRASKALRLQPYIIKVIDRGGSTDADLNLDKDFNAATTPRDRHFQPQWTGVSASLDLEKWKFEGEAVLLTGDYTASRKLNANALFLRGVRDFGRVGPLSNLSTGLQFGRGSGQGTDNTGSGPMRNFNALFLCRERNKFAQIFGQDIHAGYSFWDSNLSNITYVRLDTTLELQKGLKLTPSFTRIWTTKEVFAGRGPVFDWSLGDATSTNRTRDVGWEADLEITFPIYKHVNGFFAAGYFQPGAVYARPNGSDPGAAKKLVLGAEVAF